MKRWFRRLGPGIVTGAADDDPSGIATYSQAGAAFGLNFLWVAWFTFPLMAAVQEMCGRIGLVTRQGLASVIKANYPRPVLYLVTAILFVANVFNIGADISGMAAAIDLFIPLNQFVAGVIIATTLTLLVIRLSYKTIAAVFKWLTLALLAYVLTFFVVKMDYSEIIRSTVRPDFATFLTPAYLLTLVGVLGTTISPYLFFWQTAEESEEEKLRHEIISSHSLAVEKEDTIIGMFYSNAVTFFIIAVTGTVLYGAGIRDISTATEAAMALRPLAGDLAYILFAVGIIGTGVLAIPILAGSAAYAVSETLGFDEGLNKRFGRARNFYLVIILAMALGFILNFIGLPPMKYLFYAAVLNGIVAPVLILMILLVANNQKIMGNYVNGWKSNLLGFLSFVLMAACAIAVVVNTVR